MHLVVKIATSCLLSCVTIEVIITPHYRAQLSLLARALVTGQWQTAGTALGAISALSMCSAKCHRSQARGPTALGISQTCARSP